MCNVCLDLLAVAATTDVHIWAFDELDTLRQDWDSLNESQRDAAIEMNMSKGHWSRGSQRGEAVAAAYRSGVDATGGSLRQGRRWAWAARQLGGLRGVLRSYHGAVLCMR